MEIKLGVGEGEICGAVLLRAIRQRYMLKPCINSMPRQNKARTRDPRNKPKRVTPTAPQMGERPRSLSGARFLRLSNSRHTEKHSAAPTGSDGSAVLVCQAALRCKEQKRVKDQVLNR